MCYVKKLVGINVHGDEVNLGIKFEGQFDCVKFDCNGCNEGFVDGEVPKRNLETVKISFDDKIQIKIKIIVNLLDRFPFRFTRQLGTGGFAEVYEGYHHGRKRAFKMIPLNEDEHQYNTGSYGCHEYYQQEYNLKQM